MAHSVAILSLLVLIGTSVVAQANPSKFCYHVSCNFLSCTKFLTGNSSEATPQCCHAIDTLNREAKRLKGAPRRICRCIEYMAYLLKIAFVSTRIEDIPNKCSTHLSFPISNTMNCSRWIHILFNLFSSTIYIWGRKLYDRMDPFCLCAVCEGWQPHCRFIWWLQ